MTSWKEKRKQKEPHLSHAGLVLQLFPTECTLILCNNFGTILSLKLGRGLLEGRGFADFSSRTRCLLSDNVSSSRRQVTILTLQCRISDRKIGLKDTRPSWEGYTKTLFNSPRLFNKQRYIILLLALLTIQKGLL